VKVTSTVHRNYQNKAGQIAVTVKVEEGAQWLVDDVALGGITQVNRNDLIRDGFMAELEKQREYAREAMNELKERSPATAVSTARLSQSKPSKNQHGDYRMKNPAVEARLLAAI
jgi:hypothetical protein